MKYNYKKSFGCFVVRGQLIWRLLQKQENDDPIGTDQEDFVRAVADVERFVWLRNHDRLSGSDNLAV